MSTTAPALARTPLGGAKQSNLAAALLAELDDNALDTLAAALAPRLAALQSQNQTPARWLNAEQAAEYIGARKDRVYDLVQLRKFEPHRDGRRLLFRPADLDAYLEAAA